MKLTFVDGGWAKEIAVAVQHYWRDYGKPDVEEIEAVDCEHKSEDHLPKCSAPVWVFAFDLFSNWLVEMTLIFLIVLNEKMVARM